MCGIVGLVRRSGTPCRLETISVMIHALRHRGPDDEGLVVFQESHHAPEIFGGIDTPDNIYRSHFLYSPKTHFDRNAVEKAVVALAHCRLSILDLSPAGHQPMCNEDGTVWIVHNGEIYNFLELREELHALGHDFISKTDTEVIVHAYEEWGERCLQKFNGMWAFVIYDITKNVLFGARDRFGIKPLYYYQNQEIFAFASEITVLLELPQISRKVNPQRLYDYLCHGMTDSGHETLFLDIRQVPPAHYIELRPNRPAPIHPKQYWHIDTSRILDISFQDAVTNVRTLFLESVRLHQRSDVPLGTALSGGIDSSAIVAAMRYLNSDLELHAFSYVAEDSGLNEEGWIDAAGKAAGVIPHKVRISPDELIEDLDRLVTCQGEPFGSTSIYAQYRVMRFARENGMKVMLDGQGADEMLAGYRDYLSARLASLFYQGKFTTGTRFFLNTANLPGVDSTVLFLLAGAKFVPEFLDGLARKLVHQDLIPRWLNKAWYKDRDVRAKAYSLKPQGRDILRQDLKHSVETRLVSLLRYEDRNSMIHSIESRVPFLHPELVQFLFSLPEEYIIAPDGTTKSVFREAMRGIVPDAILNRKDKIGFATPEQQWLETLRPWVDSVLKSRTARQIPAIHIAEMAREWQGVREGTKPFDFRIWRWVNFIRWVELFDIEFDGGICP